MIDDFEIVAASRTIIMVNGPNGLTGEHALKVRVDSENPLYALEFRNDLGLRQKIADFEEPTIISGTQTGWESGLTFETGKRGTQAKLRIAATVAGDYVVQVRVLYGGDWRSARITVKAA